MSEFLAEARILVRPDTTKFRALLEAELAAAIKPITIPVVPVVAKTNVAASTAAIQAATSGQNSVAAAAQAAGVAAQTAAASTAKLTAAQTSSAAAAKAAAAQQKAVAAAQQASIVAAQKLAFSQTEVLGAATASSAAQVTLTRSTAAVAAAQKAVGLALASNNTAIVVATENTLALATAQQAEAVAALESARANAANARALSAATAAQGGSLAQLTRGAGASGLSLLGLRGATLAASGAFLVGTAAVVGFAKAVQSAANLETELNVFAVNAGATADQMERVSAAAKALGRDITLPGVTAGTAAEAMTTLAKAGLSVEDSMTGARGALQLATAAQIDVSQSSELVANALNAFGLAGEDAVKIADLLAGAAKSAQGEIGAFGTALGQVASVADQFGVSAEDTVTLLAQLAKAGLQGGRAGTTLRVAILGLIKPTDAAGKALEKLNVAIVDQQGNFRPTAFAELNAELAKLGNAEANVIRNTIFSSDAIKVLGRATAGGVADFNAMNAAVTEAGLAQAAAAARTQGFTGSMENLSNQLEGLGLTAGEVAKGPLKLLVDQIASSVGTINDMAIAVINLKDGIGDLIGSQENKIPFLEEIRKNASPTLKRFDSDLNDNIGTLERFRNKAAETTVTIGRLLHIDTSAVQALLPVDIPKETEELSIFGAVVKSVTETINDLAAAISGAAAKAAAQGPQDSSLGVKQIQNIITGFDAKAVRDKINKDNTQLLADLQAEQAFLQRQLQRDFVKKRPALKRLIEQALLGTVQDIDAIQSKAASDAAAVKQKGEKAAKDAASAITAREQALLSQFGVARDQRQNKIAQAAQTAGLQDDINQQNKLKALVKAQIAAVKERISVEGGRAAAIAALRAILTQIDGQLKTLAEQQQAAAAERRQNLIQGTTLDIDLAQITGNQEAEVAARKKLVTQLKAQQALVKRGTVEWKELRNRIAEQNKAIADVTAEKKKQNNSFAQASFEFLQAQQGFASNLLGNLIPSGSTAGLVGGGSVTSALTPVAGAADGQSKSGPTSGQANASLSVQRQILGELKILNGDNGSPEAQRQNRNQRAVMDGVGGG